jgi:hypothetical protein
MNSEGVASLIAVVLGLLAVVGALWRWVLLPNLREQLIAPIEETRKQVTENHHTHRPPTIVDRLEDIDSRLTDIAGVTDAIGLSQTAVLKLARRLEVRVERHNAWSDEEHRRLWIVVESLLGDDPAPHESQRKGNQDDSRYPRG